MSSKKPKSKNTNSAKHLLTSDFQAPVTSHVPFIAQETIIGDLRGDKDEGFHRFFDCVDKLEPNRKFAYTTPNGLAMRISRLPQNANEYGVIYRVWIGPTISIDIRLSSITWPPLAPSLYNGEVEKYADFIVDVKSKGTSLNEDDAVKELEKAGINFSLQLYRTELKKRLLASHLESLKNGESITRKLENGTEFKVTRTRKSFIVRTSTNITAVISLGTIDEICLVISLTLVENPLHFQALLTHFNSKVTIAGQKISSAKYGWITLCLHRGLNPCIDALISEEQAN